VCPDGGHRCSSTDTVVRYRCIEQVKAYVAKVEAARVAAVAAKEEAKAEAKMNAWMEEQYASDPRPKRESVRTCLHCGRQYTCWMSPDEPDGLCSEKCEKALEALYSDDPRQAA